MRFSEMPNWLFSDANLNLNWREHVFKTSILPLCLFNQAMAIELDYHDCRASIFSGGKKEWRMNSLNILMKLVD